MQIHGVGIDVVQISRIEKSFEKFGEHFVQKVLAESERIDYRAAAHPVRFLAKRFAAKEAVAKAMRTGFRDGLWFHHIAIFNDELGAPHVRFECKAKAWADGRGITGTHISISDEKKYAVAYATLLKE